MGRVVAAHQGSGEGKREKAFRRPGLPCPLSKVPCFQASGVFGNGIKSLEDEAPTYGLTAARAGISPRETEGHVVLRFMNVGVRRGQELEMTQGEGPGSINQGAPPPE